MRIGPLKPKIYWRWYSTSGWVVVEKDQLAQYPENTRIHSHHNTEEEAEAVALALNELTQ